jgi:hypothetical protein
MIDEDTRANYTCNPLRPENNVFDGRPIEQTKHHDLRVGGGRCRGKRSACSKG